MASSAAQIASSSWSRVSARVKPALAITASGAPFLARYRSMDARVPLASAWSNSTVSTRSSPVSMLASRSAPTTLAPAARRLATSAWPMPPPAPLTRTVLPFNPNTELSIIRSSLRLLVGDAVDLDLAVHHHVALHRCARRWVLAEIALVDSVEAPEVARIIQPDPAAHHILQPIARFFQNRDDVLDREVGLLDDASPLDFAVFHGHLAGNEQEAAGLDGTGKGQVLATGPGLFGTIAFDRHCSTPGRIL